MNKYVFCGLEQYAALNLFNSEFEMNYTVSVEWEYVQDGQLTGYVTTTNNVLVSDGVYEYSYADSTYPSLIYYYYMIYENTTNYPLIYMDEDLNGEWEFVTYGMTDYEGYYSSIYLDSVQLYGLTQEDFIYDETKGYITAKNESLEDKYCSSIFSFADSYGGLRIYLKDDGNGNQVLDKIVTSLFIADDSGSYYSFLKTYTFTEINSTTITIPEGIAH